MTTEMNLVSPVRPTTRSHPNLDRVGDTFVLLGGHGIPGDSAQSPGGDR